MSWSVAAVGRAAAVRARVAAQFAGIRCSEPEETVKGAIAQAVDAALAAFPAGGAVEVTASGSQSAGADGAATNQALLAIKPLWGFVE